MYYLHMYMYFNNEIKPNEYGPAKAIQTNEHHINYRESLTNKYIYTYVHCIFEKYFQEYW